MYFLVQANDVKEAFDNTESCKAQWVNIVFQLFRNLLLWMFSYFSGEEEDLEIEKFNALKAARPEVAVDTEDTMEFAVEENCVLRFIFK
jgi:hypothetical protein